jgi:hypothetical protein
MQTIMTTAHKVAALIPHAQYAVTIEHIEAFEEALERLEEQHRGHCYNRHALRMTLICGIINYDRLV